MAEIVQVLTYWSKEHGWPNFRETVAVFREIDAAKSHAEVRSPAVDIGWRMRGTAWVGNSPNGRWGYEISPRELR